MYVHCLPPAELMLMQWKNTLASYCTSPTLLCNKVQSFLEQNQLFMKESIELYADTNPFWYQVKLFQAQLDGLLEGYSSAKLDPLTAENVL